MVVWNRVALQRPSRSALAGRLVFGGHGQSEGHAGLPEQDLHLAVELLPVVVELHDALRFGRHPELVKLIGQVTYGEET